MPSTSAPLIDPVIAPGCLDQQFRGQVPDDVDPRTLTRVEPISAAYRDRDARLATMDAQGLDAALLFLTLGCGVEPPQVRVEVGDDVVDGDPGAGVARVLLQLEQLAHPGQVGLPLPLEVRRRVGPELERRDGLADEVVVMEVYGAGEDPIPGANGSVVAAAVPLPADRVEFEPSWTAVAKRVAARARPGDVVLTLGAGDVTMLGPEILQLLTHPPNP